MNKAVMSFVLQVCVWTNVSFLWGKYQGVQLLGYMVSTCLTFEETACVPNGCTLLHVHQ